MDDVLNTIKQLEDPAISDEQKATLAAHAVQINRVNIDDSLADQATWFAWWSSVWEAARSKSALAKARWEQVKSEQMHQMTEALKYSAAKATGLLAANPEVMKAYAIYQEAAAYASNLRAIVAAFEQRKDMLVQLSANQRAEKQLY